MPVDAILVDFNEPRILAEALSQVEASREAVSTDRSLMERLADDPANAYADDEDGRSITGEK